MDGAQDLAAAGATGQMNHIDPNSGMPMAPNYYNQFQGGQPQGLPAEGQNGNFY